MSIANGDVINMTSFTHYQEDGQFSFRADKGRVAVFMLLGSASKKNLEAFDAHGAIKSMGWVPGPDLDLVVADLKEAAETLRRYEALHRAKNTEESTAKAEVNAALATRFEATIAKVTK